MHHTDNSIRKTVLKELALFLALLFLGLVILPITVFFVGQQVFGEYGGSGFSGFFNSLGSKLRDGNWVAWLLTLTPYLAWQSIRLTRFLWRVTGRPHPGSTTARN